MNRTPEWHKAEETRVATIAPLMAEWYDFRQRVYGGPLPLQAQEDECRRCFLGGFVGGFAALRHVSDLPDALVSATVEEIIRCCRLVPSLEFTRAAPA